MVPSATVSRLRNVDVWMVVARKILPGVMLDREIGGHVVHHVYWLAGVHSSSAERPNKNARHRLKALDGAPTASAGQ
jgi:hypothetical protein